MALTLPDWRLRCTVIIIRGVTYIYGMFYRFGLIDVPDEVKEKMGHPKKHKK